MFQNTPFSDFKCFPVWITASIQVRVDKLSQSFVVIVYGLTNGFTYLLTETSDVGSTSIFQFIFPFFSFLLSSTSNIMYSTTLFTLSMPMSDY